MRVIAAKGKITMKVVSWRIYMVRKENSTDTCKLTDQQEPLMDTEEGRAVRNGAPGSALKCTMNASV